MSKFLQWWIVFLLQIAGLVGVYYFGLLSWIWAHDLTKISIGVMVLWALSTMHLGYKIWKEERSVSVYSPYETINADSTWFTSDQCLALGMLGTVIGFCIMVSGISLGSDLTNPTVLHGIITAMANGMSTTMITTGVGLFFGNLLKIQAYFFTRAE